MPLFVKDDRVRYEPITDSPVWEFRIGREGIVTRDQEPGDVTVPVHFDEEDSLAYPYTVNLVKVASK